MEWRGGEAWLHLAAQGTCALPFQQYITTLDPPCTRPALTLVAVVSLPQVLVSNSVHGAALVHHVQECLGPVLPPPCPPHCHTLPSHVQTCRVMVVQARIQVLVPSTSLASDGSILLGIEAAANDSALGQALQIQMSSVTVARAPGKVPAPLTESHAVRSDAQGDEGEGRRLAIVERGVRIAWCWLARRWALRPLPDASPCAHSGWHPHFCNSSPLHFTPAVSLLAWLSWHVADAACSVRQQPVRGGGVERRLLLGLPQCGQALPSWGGPGPSWGSSPRAVLEARCVPACHGDLHLLRGLLGPRLQLVRNGICELPEAWVGCPVHGLCKQLHAS